MFIDDEEFLGRFSNHSQCPTPRVFGLAGLENLCGEKHLPWTEMNTTRAAKERDTNDSSGRKPTAAAICAGVLVCCEVGWLDLCLFPQPRV